MVEVKKGYKFRHVKIFSNYINLKDLVYMSTKQNSEEMREAMIKRDINNRTKKYMTTFGYLTVATSFFGLSKLVYKSKWYVTKTLGFVAFVWSATHFFRLG